MNKQPITKQDLSRNGVTKPFEVAEIFDSLQGEGPWSGLPVTFIRMAGCNLRCTWCDTDYSIKHLITLEDFRHKKLRNRIVFTGGEPFRQNISELVKMFIHSGHRVQVETNGTLILPNFPFEHVLIVCSPKTDKINKKLPINVFKYVVSFRDAHSSDGMPMMPTQTDGGKPPYHYKGSKEVILMPLDEGNKFPHSNKESMDTAVHLCQKFNFRLNLQLHKILRIR